MPELLKPIAEELIRKESWDYIDYVGDGAFKEVYKINVGNNNFALKICDPHKSNPARTVREIDAMLKCNSERIAKIEGCGKHLAQNGIEYIYIVEEFLGGGNLTDYISNNTISHDQVKDFGMSLAEALLHLDRINLVHRDIKPDNIMFPSSQMSPKLVDFGIVRDLTQRSLTADWLPRGPGTPLYSAPEQLNNRKAMINWRTDQFSLGLVLGKCLLGYHPFQDSGMTDPQIVDNIGNWKPVPQRFTNDATLSNMKFLLKMIEPWPINRFDTPEELIQEIQ